MTPLGVCLLYVLFQSDMCVREKYKIKLPFQVPYLFGKDNIFRQDYPEFTETMY